MSLEQTNNQALKTLNQIEFEQKQRIVFKPKGDRFFQPLSLIFIFLGFIMLAIALVLNGYSFGNYQIATTNPLPSIIPKNYVDMPQLVAAAGTFFTAAAIFLISFIIKFSRALVFVRINEDVRLKDVDAHLITKFTVRVFIYLFMILSVVTVSMMGVTDIALYHNLFAVTSFKLQLHHYWFITAVLAILTACVFIFCLIAEFFQNLSKRIRDYLNKKDDPESLMMKNRRKQESYVRLLMISIVFWTARLTLLIFAIALFIYGGFGLSWFDSMGITSLKIAFSSISVVFYISAAWFMIVLPVMQYTLILDYRILNHDKIVELRIKKEKTRTEKIKMKALKKEIKHA